MYMNYFIAQEFGEDYYRRADEVVDLSRHRRTIDKVITDCFEQVVYSINQPTGARNFQAVFWNIAYYDRYYFESAVRRVPSSPTDQQAPTGRRCRWLQKALHEVVQRANGLATVLTFPVETMALLTRKRRRDGQGVGRFHGRDVCRGTFVLHLHERQCRLAVGVLPPAQRDPRTTGSATRSAPEAYRPARRAC